MGSKRAGTSNKRWLGKKAIFCIALNVNISKTVEDTAKSCYLYEVAYAVSIDKIDEFGCH